MRRGTEGSSEEVRQKRRSLWPMVGMRTIFGHRVESARWSEIGKDRGAGGGNLILEKTRFCRKRALAGIFIVVVVVLFKRGERGSGRAIMIVFRVGYIKWNDLIVGINGGIGRVVKISIRNIILATTKL